MKAAKLIKASLFCVIILSAAGQNLHADQVFLVNGDRLTGNIIRLDNKHLVFSVEYSEKTLSFSEDNGSHTLIDLKENGTIEAEKKTNKELQEIGIAAERPDEIIIQWDMVKCIDSDGNKRFVLSDQQSFIGSAKCVDAGMVKISDGIIRETIPIPLSSIVSINPPPPPSEITFRTILNAGGSLQTGNTDAVEGHFSTLFGVKSKRHKFQVVAKYNYGETNENINTRNASSNLHYSFFMKEKIYSYAQTLFETDDMQGLNLRSTQGIGFGYQFYDNQKIRLFAEGGISNVNEAWQHKASNRRSSLRASVGLDNWIYGRILKIYHIDEVYLGLENNNMPVYITTSQGIRLRLGGNFYTNLEYNLNYTSNAEPDKKKIDTVLTFGLSYEQDYR